MRRFAILVLLGGCSGPSTPTEPTNTGTPAAPSAPAASPTPATVPPTRTVAAAPAAPAPPSVAASPKRTERELAYVGKVESYLDESRALIKLSGTIPSTLKFAQRKGELADLYTRIPDAPSSLDPEGKLAEMLKQINLHFDLMALHVRLLNDSINLNAAELADKGKRDCEKLASEQRTRIDDVATFLGIE